MVGVELVVGGWFAAAAIAKLADKIRDYLEGQYKYRKGVKKALKKLQQNLTTIQAVIHAAEQQTQIQNPGLAKWLRDLKDAACDAEDLLDKFDYQLLKAKVEKQNKVRRNFVSSSSHKILKHAKALVKHLFFSDGDLNELREIVRSFDGICAQTGDFLKLVEFNESVNRRQETLEWRQTTSRPVEPEIVGRDIMINKIVNSLVRRTGDSRSNSNEIFSVLSIVGIGGVGKTTVAQHVFYNNEINERFDPKIWVCVSETFDVRRLTIQIIMSCCKKEKEMMGSTSSDSKLNNLHLMTLEDIQEILREKLKDKRFLIVLDDAWNEVRSEWENLCKPFKLGKEGSRIMVTTRSHKVARAVGTKETVDLEGLEEEDFWAFFKQCAFGDKILEHHPKLELIGREIAKKLGGLPLAAKTVGSILNPKLEDEHWRGILKSKLWELEQQGDGIMPALKLSYDYLPAHLKQCFAYCSLFPKDYLFDKEKLVQLWMAQGFVPHHEERMNAEDIGVQYFDYLLQRCFFQKSDGRLKDGYYKIGYKIHDLLHDLAESVIDDECCRITNAPVQIPKRPRHLYIDATNHQLEKCENVSDICDIKKLRSLVVASEFSLSEYSSYSGLVRFIEYILKESKQLRVLIMLPVIPFDQLSLEAIGALVHLRYIEIIYWDYDMLNLPESWCKHYHLQFLEMNHNPQIHVSNCINLRHLNGGWIKPAQVIGIGKLTCLQEIENYYVNDEYGCGIGQLKNLRQLRGRLHIHNLENVRNKEEASEAMLHNKEHLEFLRLTWTEGVQDHREEIIEELRPHNNLTRLQIQGYGGITSPSWLSKTWLSNLETIRLQVCSAWAVLPPFGQLPFLKFLSFKHMHSVKEVGAEFYGSDDDDDTAFPSLEELHFENLDEWEQWLGPKKDRLLFPRLRKLDICGCPKLRRTLVLPNPSQEFNFYVEGGEIEWLDDAAAPSKLKIHIDYHSQQFIWGLSEEVLASIKYLQINCCFDITSLSFLKNIIECFQKLTSLKELSFYNCNTFGSFPVDVMSLTSLESLEITECSNFESLLEGGLPTSLKELYIRPCAKELEKRCQISNGCDWPKISHIPCITIGETIVRNMNEAAPL